MQNKRLLGFSLFLHLHDYINFMFGTINAAATAVQRDKKTNTMKNSKTCQNRRSDYIEDKRAKKK